MPAGGQTTAKRRRALRSSGSRSAGQAISNVARRNRNARAPFGRDPKPAPLSPGIRRALSGTASVGKQKPSLKVTRNAQGRAGQIRAGSPNENAATFQDIIDFLTSAQRDPNEHAREQAVHDIAKGATDAGSYLIRKGRGKHTTLGPSIDPGRIADVGLKTAGATAESLLSARGASQTAKELGRTALATVPGIAEAGYALGAAALGDDTKLNELIDTVSKDYSRRYGALWEDKPGAYDEMVKRMKAEGAAGELFDLASAGGAVGATTGRIATQLARRGLLGNRAQRLAEAIVRDARPGLRVAHGKVRPQKYSKNLYTATAQRKLDKMRSSRDVARQQKFAAGEAHRPTVEPGPNEVTPIFNRSRARAQRIAHSAVGSKARLGMREDLHAMVAKGAGPLIAKLDKNERQGFAWAMANIIPRNVHRADGTIDHEAVQVAKEALDKYEQKILAHRAEEERRVRSMGRDPKEVLYGDHRYDNLNELRFVRDNVEKVLTPRLEETVNRLQPIDEWLVRNDPALVNMQARTRRNAQFAALHGPDRLSHVEHTPLVSDEALAQMEQALAAMNDHLASVEAQTVKGHRVVKLNGKGKVQRIVGKGKTQEEALQAAAEKHPEVAGLAAGKEVPGFQIEPIRARASTKAAKEAERLRGIRDYLQAEVNGLRHGNEQIKETLAMDETNPDYQRRIEEAMRSMKHVGDQALYFPAEAHSRAFIDTLDMSPTHAAAGHRAYTGKLFDLGMQNLDPEAYTRALTRGIRRKWNWRQFEQVLNEQAVPLGNSPLRHEQAKRLLMEKGYKPEDFVLLHPGAFRKVFSERMLTKGEATAADLAGHDSGLIQLLDEAAQMTDEPGFYEKVHELAMQSLKDTTSPHEGWVAVPRPLLEEMRASANVERTGAGRAWDTTKHAASSLLLGTSPPWLAYQVASNGIVSALATRGNVKDIVAAQMWFRKLDPEVQKALNIELGSASGWDDPHMYHGAPASDKHYVNAYRGFKKTVFHKDLVRWGKVNEHGVREHGLTVAHFNPVKGLLHLDKVQNDVFRRTLLYNQAKRDAFKKMSADMGLAAVAQEHLFRRSLKGEVESLVKDPAAVERYATHVNDMLGDYTRYTAAERKHLSRYVMFYGFMRYSLKLMFRTLPAKHPLVLLALGQLGQLHKNEVYDLLGRDYAQALASVYFGPNGETSVDWGRANPVSNSLLQMRGPAQLIGVTSPFAQEAVNQALGISTFTGQPYTVEGENQPRSDNILELAGQIGLEDRARILANDMLGMAYPFRLWGAINRDKNYPAGSDSLPWDPRPKQYVRSDVVDNIDAERKRLAAERKDLPQFLLSQMLPQFIPAPNNDKATAQRLREQRKAAKAKREGSGGGSGGGHSVGKNVRGGSGSVGSNVRGGSGGSGGSVGSNVR